MTRARATHLPTWVRRALLAAAGVLVALLLTEIVLRAGLYEALPLPIEAPIFAMAGEGRIGLRANVNLRSRGGEWDVRLITNQHGLRDVERPASASGFRILGLGDSFTFAWGVPVEAGYLARAEDILEGELGSTVEVVKAAVPGWGPGDELAWLRVNWEQWRPKLLLLGFAAGNDFYDTMVDGARQYEVIEGIQVPRIRHRGVPTTFKAFLRRHSALYRAAAALSPGLEMRLGDLRGNTLHWRVNDVFLRNPPPETVAAFDATFRILDAMTVFAAERHAKFAVVVIPSRAQVHGEDYVLFKKRFGFREEDLDMGRPQRELAAWALRRGVPLLDLRPAMSEATRGAPTRLYFRGDSHWTEAGHLVAGRLVTRFLIDRRLIGAESAEGRVGRGSPFRRGPALPASSRAIQLGPCDDPPVATQPAPLSQAAAS